MPGPFSGLSVKIIATLVVVILAVEVIIYLPSAANFRQSWLEDRMRIGTVAARVLDAAPDAMNLPRMLTDRLLSSAGAYALVYRRDEQSQLIERDNFDPPDEVVTVDMRQRDPVSLTLGTLDTLLAPSGRTLRIVGEEDGQPDRIIEVLMPESPLKAELWLYSRNLFFPLAHPRHHHLGGALSAGVAHPDLPDPAAHQQHGGVLRGAREPGADRRTDQSPR